MGQKLTVGLCQINAGFSGANYLPYSVGLLEAYARKSIPDIDRFEFMTPIFMRESVDLAVEKLLPADVACFSLYVWNNQLSLAIAKELKRIKPGIIIVVGGPHVPDKYKSHVQNKQAILTLNLKKNSRGVIDPTTERTQTYLRKNRYIDIAVHGEGERPFSILLQNLYGDWEKTPSISYLDRDGFIVQTERISRLKDLDEIPSPYLEGTFDSIIKTYPGMEWITVWETNRGCPFSCTFCDWGSAVASKINKWEVGRVCREMDWFAQHKVQFVFLADANFGILPRDIDIAKYCAEIKKKTGYPNTITVSNTKNATDRSYQVQKIFADAGLAAGASLSMQSLDPQTLIDIKRDNINLDSYREIQRRMKEDGISAFTDIVLGLPGETYDSFANGVDELIRSGLHDRVLFYNLTILPNAEMGDPNYQKLHGMKTVQARSVNIHGSRKEVKGDISEIQEVVIATKTMPEEDWVRVCVFRWASAFLHFDKVLQIPFVLAHKITGASYRELIELLSEGNFGESDKFPVLSRIRQFFIAKAQSIQCGEEEFCHSSEHLDMWWPSDEYMLIDIATSGNLSAFYQEACEALELLLGRYNKKEYKDAIREAVRLNQYMLKLPFRTGNQNLSFLYNIWEFYNAAIRNKPVSLEKRESVVTINYQGEQWDSWEDWCRQVVWYGSKRSAYLYGNAAVIQIAGHY
jgi:radical SAM superfamily enzyme YgiQ (UPF0313 family)